MKKETRNKLRYALAIIMLIVFIIGLIPSVMVFF